MKWFLIFTLAFAVGNCGEQIFTSLFNHKPSKYRTFDGVL